MTANQERRWCAELEIIKEIGKVPSSREMQRLLKEKYAIVANHNIINDDLKRDLESLTDTEYNNQKSGILQMLDIEIDIAHNIVTSNPDEELKLKAANTVTKLSKTKAEILIKFRKARAELAKAEKPVYNVFIGQPKQTDLNRLKKLESTIENDEKEDNDEKEIQ